MSNVASELLSSTSRLVVVNLSATLMTDEQTRVMWDAIMEKDCKFKSFEMTGVNLGNVGIEVLSDDPISSLVAVASLEPPARPNSSCAAPPLPASPSCKDPAFTGWNKQ